MREELFTSDVDKIQPFLMGILQDGGRMLYSIDGVIGRIFNANGMSGFDYKEENMRGEVSVGLILGGTGFSLKRLFQRDEEIFQRHDYFNERGELTFTSDQEALRSVIVDFHEMDSTCPILNHLYNFLSMEYGQALEGKTHTKIVAGVEGFLRQLYALKTFDLPIKKGVEDPSIKNHFEKILSEELDPVLSWEERQLVFKNIQSELATIVETKVRAHRLNSSLFSLKLLSMKWDNFFTRFTLRPQSNAKGLTYQYTIGKILWFFQTVKNNLGYSVALAVYGPFTYYFITMPMNPHAMQAVGRVRSFYLESKEGISSIINRSSETLIPTASLKGEAKTDPVTSDVVKTTAAAPLDQSHVIFESLVTKNSSTPLVLKLSENSEVSATPTFLNMLLTIDSPQIDGVTWNERMSNFKQMQIAFEENIEYASRMGRLEQLETQYNFPMQIEATWEELERYNNFIFKLRSENPNLSPKMKQYLFNEVNRTQQLELYLWDRMGRFIQDQIYVMLDQDKEQKRSDYYVGRSFIFMEEMTNILSWRHKNLKSPRDYDKIKALASAYSKARKEMGGVAQNLKANSDLFKQKDIYDTQEFRAHMKRQWEILFLQNSKAEEASNMGLNMYIWSVRNTAWVLQTLYSAKREELPLLIKRDVTGQLLTPEELLSKNRTSLFYENLIHNLTLEFVGIREEIMKRMGKDIESVQRMTVIENLNESISDREKLEKFGVAKSEPKSETQL